MNNTISVAILDDHPLVTSSIESILNKKGYFTISGVYHNGEELIKGLKESEPEVLILDYHMPDDNGAKLAKYVTYYHPKVKILALTGYDKQGLSEEMLESGCFGFLLKTSAQATSLIDAIHTVYEGKLYLDKSLQEKFSESVRLEFMRELGEEKPQLTRRELEILTLIVNDFSNQEIADKLHISKNTVQNHRASILMKTGAKSNFSLMKIAMELRLI